MNFFKKIFLISLTLIIFVVSSACQQANDAKREVISSTEFVLNTAATISLYDSDDYNLITESFKICRDYENLLSKTIEDSEIGRINTRKTNEVSTDTAELLELSLEFAEQSNGAFDITIGSITDLWDFTSNEKHIPDQELINVAKQYVDYRTIKIADQKILFENENTKLDLGAIAKGFIADQVKEYLVEQGVTSAIINLGGNVQCIGRKDQEKGFRVGIQKPFDSGSIVEIELNDEFSSVVTSGVYQRYFEKENQIYHHIIDPKTGYPTNNHLLSVTIISKDSSSGDALSTACLVLGLEKGMKLIDEKDDLYAIFIDDDFNIYYSEGLQETLITSE